MDAEDILRESEGAYDEGQEGGKGKDEVPEDNEKDSKEETSESEKKAIEEGKGQEKVKQGITSLDLRFLVRELRQRLVGGVFRKIYQYSGKDTKQMIIGFHVPGRGEQLLYADSSKLFLTEKKEPAPQEPASFCMFLRKHLMGKKLKDVVQHGFDRIIELHVQDHILIFELFSKGNVILCDSSYGIIMPMEIQRWRHREIRPKQAYRFPPGQNNPFLLEPGSFYRTISRSEKNLIATLASSLALGPVYAKEVCRRAGVECMQAAHSVTANDASKLHMLLLELDKARPEPCVYSGVVSPFPLKSVSEEPKRAESFSAALDEFFSFQMLETRKKDAEKVVRKRVERIERMADKQAKASEKWDRIAGDSKDSADRIYNYYATVEAVVNGIRKAKDSGLSWEDIKQKIQGEATPEAESVKDIREGDGVVVLDLGGKDVEIDFTKSPEDNAARYYDEAKWAKGKTKGAEAALEATGKRLESAKVAGKEEPAEGAEGKASAGDKPADKVIGEEKPKKIRKRWYEYYRWFVSSDGLVVIAGKNAQQNENIVKKRLEPNDLVFHSDIKGAAFVIIKSVGKTIPQETIREASEFAAAHSKAWAKGLGKIDVFAAKPGQISKASESGVNAPKGAFFVKGERSWFRGVPVKLAIGVWINHEEGWAKVIAGPLMPVRRLAQYFVTLRPGFSRPPELAARIKRSLMMKATPEDKYFIEQAPLDDFQGQIPSGMSDMIEGAGDF